MDWFTILEIVRTIATIFLAIGGIVATGAVIWAWNHEDISPFRALVFWAVMYISWPGIVWEAFYDWIRNWAYEHLDIYEDRR